MINMSKINYVTRNDKIPVTIDGDHQINCVDILEDFYPYILDSIKSEGHIVENSYGDYFKEILFEDKVVGFICYEQNAPACISLNEIYILPEFRGNKLFLNEILSVYRGGFELFISQPTRNLVDILIHHRFAKKIHDNIVISAIAFSIPPHCIKSLNDSNDIDLDNIYASNVYDLNICATLILEDISTPGVCNIKYSELLDDDCKYNSVTKRRELLDYDYFLNIKNVFLSNPDEFIYTILSLKEKLPSSELDFDEIVGKDDDLSPYMQNMVDEKIISIDKAFNIKKQLTEEYNENIVTDDGLLTRLNFLIDFDAQINDVVDFDSYDELLCPCCKEQFNLSQDYCLNCGFNLIPVDFEEDFPDLNDLELMDSFVEIFNEDDENKQFNLFLTNLINDKNFRGNVLSIDEDNEEIVELLELIDNNPVLKQSLINEISEENMHLNHPDDEDKLPILIIKLLLNNKKLRDEILTDDVKSREFLDLIDNDQELKEFVLNSLDDENYDEDEFLVELSSKIQNNENFKNFFADFKKESSLDPEYIDTFLCEFIELMTKNYSLDANPDLSLNKNLEIFNFLTFANKAKPSDIALLFDNLSDSSLKSFIIDEGFITNKLNSETFSIYAQEFFVDELKDILRVNNLRVSGKKQELVDRLNSADIYYDFANGEKYFLTKKGREFLEEYSWIRLYIEFFNNFEFADLNKFYSSHEGNDLKIAHEYLDAHFEKSWNIKDSDYMIDCLDVKSELYINEEDNLYAALECLLNSFCLGVNPVYYIDNFYEEYSPLKTDLMEKLKILSAHFSQKEIFVCFDKIWDNIEFNKFIVNKKEAKNILNELLTDPDCSEYNKELARRVHL